MIIQILEDNQSKKLPLIYSIIYGLKKETLHPNDNINYNKKIYSNQENYNNFSPQNNYMFNSEQGLNEYSNNIQQIKSPNNLGI